MQRQRVPDIWNQVKALGEGHDVARDFLISVMLAEASDSDQNLGKYKGVYQKNLEQAMSKPGRGQ